MRYGIKPGQKRASALRIGMRVMINGEVVTLTNVINRNSGGGLGCTDLYWSGGKSGGASERPVTVVADDLANFIDGLEID